MRAPWARPSRRLAPTSAWRAGREDGRLRGAQAGGACHSRTHTGGMQTAGLPCGHVSAPPT